MKNLRNTFTLILLLILMIISSTALAQFKGKMVFNNMDEGHSFDVFCSDLGYRYEFDEDGQKGVVIVKKGSQEVIILMPQQKMAIKTNSTSQMSMGRDPLKQYEYWLNEGATEKVVGNEKVNGIDCIEKELRNVKKDEYGKVNQHLFTVWYSEEYNFPIKMENYIDGSGPSGMEVTDIEPWTPSADSFKVPSGYSTMEM